MRWEEGVARPPVSGLVLKVGRRYAVVDADRVAEATRTAVRLMDARLDLAATVRRPGDVALARDVLDRLLVNLDGIQVVRASDLRRACARR